MRVPSRPSALFSAAQSWFTKSSTLLRRASAAIAAFCAAAFAGSVKFLNSVAQAAVGLSSGTMECPDADQNPSHQSEVCRPHATDRTTPALPCDSSRFAIV